ncbi:winged helix-turn-helix transcriptional regulator [Amaricoccus tamworthensis]|uniref:winged helix-turn-helix transcriptional regulator n=1 Tax=Amaricoccus tamworthensis TaxID=57002 RepID=UPI003C7A1B81
MDTNTLVKLTSRAWSLDILAHLHEGIPGRQAALLTATGAGRTALSQSLHHLIDLGLLERNPGHGHPLRPEFRLTAKGEAMAAIARKIIRLTPDETERCLIRRSWTVPVLALSREPRQFSTLRRDLPPITDRALSQSLKNLQGSNWLTRHIDPAGHPPRPLYQATGRGLEIGQAIGI